MDLILLSLSNKVFEFEFSLCLCLSLSLRLLSTQGDVSENVNSKTRTNIIKSILSGPPPPTIYFFCPQQINHELLRHSCSCHRFGEVGTHLLWNLVNRTGQLMKPVIHAHVSGWTQPQACSPINEEAKHAIMGRPSQALGDYYILTWPRHQEALISPSGPRGQTPYDLRGAPSGRKRDSQRAVVVL